MVVANELVVSYGWWHLVQRVVDIDCWLIEDMSTELRINNNYHNYPQNL